MAGEPVDEKRMSPSLQMGDSRKKDSPVNGTSATMSTGISEPMSGR
jgi:hypothetical protein